MNASEVRGEEGKGRAHQPGSTPEYATVRPTNAPGSTFPPHPAISLLPACRSLILEAPGDYPDLPRMNPIYQQIPPAIKIKFLVTDFWLLIPNVFIAAMAPSGVVAAVSLIYRTPLSSITNSILCSSPLKFFIAFEILSLPMPIIFATQIAAKIFSLLCSPNKDVSDKSKIFSSFSFPTNSVNEIFFLSSVPK